MIGALDGKRPMLGQFLTEFSQNLQITLSDSCGDVWLHYIQLTLKLTRQFSPLLVLRGNFQINIFQIFNSQVTETRSHFLTGYVIVEI